MVEPACAAARNSSSSGSASAAPRSGANLAGAGEREGRLRKTLPTSVRGARAPAARGTALHVTFGVSLAPQGNAKYWGEQCYVQGSPLLEAHGLIGKVEPQGGVSRRHQLHASAGQEACQIRLQQPTSCDSAALHSTCERCKQGLLMVKPAAPCPTAVGQTRQACLGQEVVCRQRVHAHSLHRASHLQGHAVPRLQLVCVCRGRQETSMKHRGM